MSTTPPPTAPIPPTEDGFARSLAPDLRALVEATAPITPGEVRTGSTSASVAVRRSPVGWRVAAAAAVLVVLVAGGLGWRQRVEDRPVADSLPGTELLAVPADPTGPVPAVNTAASTGDPDRATAARWDVVRTGADDRQLVVFFDGGGCGTYRAEVSETDAAVSIAIHPATPDDGGDCPAIAGPGAIGIQLEDPLGARRLEGSRPVDGNDVTGPLTVPGPDLATLTWPAGSERAAVEDLHRGLGPDAYVWTQRFDGPAGDDGAPQAVSLEQWHGASPIDDGAVYQTCRGEAGATEPVSVNGNAATLVRCSDSSESPPRSGAKAVLWMDGDDRLMVRAEPGTTALDDNALLTLAESVRRGS